jgi:hypothetical protein
MKKTLFLFFTISYSILFCQENITEKFINPFQKDAPYREKVFLHLNKSVYFTNETVWVTAYVAEDVENKPSLYTSNLHINLIDLEGNLIQQKTTFIQNGVGNGDFLLDNNLATGKYFIQGFTNYMRNFGKEYVFIQEIEIINSTIKKEINQEQYTPNYDIQLFPESGYLLENVENTLGIKALINGKGFPFFGEIINSNGIKITDFKGNMLGMGKCKFTYTENEAYTAIIKINNTIQKIELPKANKTGIIFSLDNTIENQIVLTLKTNIRTLPALQKSNLSLIFYRNNYISQAASLSLINSEKTTQEIVFDKSKLLNGVNIVTLFKDKQPIAERKFFVDKYSEQTAILINELKTEKDSTSFKIKTINSNFKPEISQLSISVLPKNAKNFHENQTIKSAFLLSPYLKGKIENPAYYFKNNSPKKKEFLDLLLLNQGWSTYSLEEKIKEINPRKSFTFESGFTISGKIKWYPKGYNIGVISKKGGLVALSEFNKNKEFSFDNVFKFKNDSLKIALIRNKYPMVKPTKISLITNTSKALNYTFIKDKYNKNPIIKSTKEYSSSENLDINNFKTLPNVEVLEQIVLKTVKSKRKRTFYDDEMDLAFKHKIPGSSFYKSKKVTEEMGVKYLNVLHYFRSLGLVRGLCPYSCFIQLTDMKTSFGATPIPLIYVDDVTYNIENSITLFESLSMTDIDDILINRRGFGGGINASGGIIRIYLKKGNHKYYKYGNTLYKDLISLTGFDKANNYFKPQYDIYSQDAYNWTEIDWKNNLQTNESGEVIIKIPTNEFSNEFQFIINGFSKNGLLFNTNYKSNLDGF